MYITYVIYGSTALFTLFFITLFWNVLKNNKKQDREHSEYISNPPNSDELSIFSEALQIKTVASVEDSEIDPEQFERYKQFLSIHFPFIYTKLKVVWLNPFAFYIKWPGKKTDLNPVLLYSHFDVVPAEDEGWTHPPFSGTIENGLIWGRGALDTKNTMISSMLALEEMLMHGISPERSVYMACGGDEEVMGIRGAMKLAHHFEERGIEFAWMLDEGALIQEGMLKGLKQPVALIGTEEKGVINIKISCLKSPGHASMPTGHTAADIITRAVTNLEKQTFKPNLTPATKQFFIRQIPYVGFGHKLIFANLWFFKKLLFHMLNKSPSSASIIRTTMTVTMPKGSDKTNILPARAEVSINFRILPGESMESVLKEVKKRIGDNRVNISIMDKEECNNPVNTSQLNGPGYQAISQVLAHVAPDAVQLPFTANETTDSRKFSRICAHIYRFAPMKLNIEQLSLIHDTNERISFDNFALGLDFYRLLLQTI